MSYLIICWLDLEIGGSYYSLRHAEGLENFPLELKMCFSIERLYIEMKRASSILTSREAQRAPA
jgi:hypothetical protein